MKTPLTVLLIEDDADDQFFFMEALREIDNAFLYALAKNGQEALDRLRGAAILPDIIFSDINMPVMGGLDCLVELKKNLLTKDIPVVIISSDTALSEMACHLGAKAFIQKSAWGDLRENLEEMINRDWTDSSDTAFQTFAAVEEHRPRI